MYTLHTYKLSFSLSILYTYTCIYIYIYMHIYIYIYIDREREREMRKHMPAFQEGAGSVRFVSVPDFSTIHRFGSVRFVNICFPVRRYSACVFRTRPGSVRFGSASGSGRFQNSTVRFGSAASVRFLFPSWPSGEAGQSAGITSLDTCDIES